MSIKLRYLFLCASLVWLTLACAAPVFSSVTPTVARMVEQPVAADTVEPTQTIAPTVSVSITPVPSLVVSTATVEASVVAITFPKITFERNTNCRLGPAVNYFTATSFLKARYTLAEGRNADSSWLWVRTTDAALHCWVSVANINKPENYDYLPVVDFPSLPEAPTLLFVEEKSCGVRNLIRLKWSRIIRETGFHIYRNGIMLASLKTDAVSYIDTPAAAEQYIYELESINNDGVSVRVRVIVSGCH